MRVPLRPRFGWVRRDRLTLGSCPTTEPAPASRPDRIRQGDREKAYRPLPLDDRRAAFDEGLGAYDGATTSSAHEALEPAWMGTDDLEERALHQGLIKVAAGVRPRRAPQPARGSPRTSTGARAAPRQSGAAAAAWGVDVPALLADIDARLADPAIAADPAPEHPEDPARMNRPDRHPGRRSPVRRHPAARPRPARGPPRRARAIRVRRGPRRGLAAHPDVAARRPDRRGPAGPAGARPVRRSARGRSR